VKVTSLGLFLLLTFLVGPVPAVAHHGAASFDTSMEVTLKGTVTEWQWFNPHCFLKFDVTGDDGYMFEKRWRVIWTDGRQLPDNPDPRWYGYSVGRWEDDTTFVVETVGMDDRTWVDNSGYPHSTSLRVTERYQRVSQNTLELTVTIDDPLVYTKPWIARNRLPLKLMPPGTDLMEMIPSASEAQAYTKTISSQTK
jgi:hypothetical protein